MLRCSWLSACCLLNWHCTAKKHPLQEFLCKEPSRENDKLRTLVVLLVHLRHFQSHLLPKQQGTMGLEVSAKTCVLMYYRILQCRVSPGCAEAGMEGRQGVPSQGMGTSLNSTPPMPDRRSTWPEQAALACCIALN